MAISDTITSMYENVGNVYDVLELAGADLTNVDKNIENLKQSWEERLLYFLGNGTGTLWNNWEKVTGSGTSVTLNNTMKGNMRITLNGNTSGSRLPSGYTEVAYIESNGTQYIDTMISSITRTFAIEMDFSITTQQSFQALYCCRTDNSTNTRTCFVTDLSGFRNDQGNQYTMSKTLSLNKKYKLKSTETEFTLDGVVLSNVTTSTAVNSNVRLLSAYPIGDTSSSVYPFYGRLYGCKIWDNNILKRDYVPCSNSDNEIGLYDLVNDVFYRNAGTGTFRRGPNISVVGVGGNNNIEIECKNLFSFSNFTTKNNVSMTNKGVISATGMATTAWDYSNSNWIKTLEPGTYQLTVYFLKRDTSYYPYASIRVYNSSGTQLSRFDNLQNITTRTRTITLTEETTIGVMFKLSDGVCTFQIEKGTQATEYMAPQTYPIDLGTINLGLGDKIQGTLNNWEVLRANNTTEIITNELLIYQLNDLYQNAKSNDTTTTIIQTNEGLPFILDVVALKKLEI
jgi:hypothetical protein